MSTLYSTSSRAKEPPPPLPPPHPAPHAHYSTHFPSTWRLSMPHTKRRLSATSLIDPQDSPASSRPKLTPQPSSARPLPIRQASRERTPTQQQQQQQQQERTEAAAAAHETAMADATANTAAMSTTSQNMADGTSRDLMAELQSEPSQDVDMGVQIGMWVDRVSSHGSFSSQSITATTTTMNTSTALDEDRMPSVAVGAGGHGPDMDVDMDGSDDASGLGDAAHVPRGMLHENYSIYSESTNRVEQGCEG